MRNGKEFSAMIRNARKKKGFSLAELSEKIGKHDGEGDSEDSLSASYIHRLETGERSTPSVHVVVTLAKALDINMYDMLNIEDDEREPRSLASLLFSNEVIMEEVILTSRSKELLLELIDFVVNLSDQETMAIKVSKLIETAEQFQKEIRRSD